MELGFRRRKRDHAVVCTLPSDLVEVLADVIGQLEGVLSAPEPGPVRERLFPRAYLDPTEEAAEQEWQAFVHDDLVRERTAALHATVADLHDATRVSRTNVEIVLDDDAALRWCRVLNDARLTLGTALGVSEDEPLAFSDDDPRAAGAEMYDLLTSLQGELVDVLARELPEAGTADDPAF
jgi:hypothetical protein